MGFMDGTQNVSEKIPFPTKSFLAPLYKPMSSTAAAATLPGSGWMDFNNIDVKPTVAQSPVSLLKDPIAAKTPKIGGGWMEGGKLALGAAEVGLGVYNALEQSKMNKFMQSYYGDTMKRDNLDFDNAAKDARRQLNDQSERVASARGMAIGSQENKDFTSNRMNEWGASTLA